MLIDFHTHILPGIDDGSRDIEMTGAMLGEERRQGVQLVVATPHFYANQTSVERFLSLRTDALDRTEALRSETGETFPAVMVGAEVYYFQGMGKAEAISRLCIGETRALLLEMPFEQWTEAVLKDVEELIRRNLTIVLAHIERYHGFQKDKGVWHRMLSLPVTFQINAGSFIKKGGFFRSDGKRKFCLGFLEAHDDVIIGSDCHNMEGRRPNLSAARAEIERALGRAALDKADDAARRLLISQSDPPGQA